MPSCWGRSRGSTHGGDSGGGGSGPGEAGTPGRRAAGVWLGRQPQRRSRGRAGAPATALPTALGPRQQPGGHGLPPTPPSRLFADRVAARCTSYRQRPTLGPCGRAPALCPLPSAPPARRAPCPLCPQPSTGLAVLHQWLPSTRSRSRGAQTHRAPGQLPGATSPS